MNRCAEGDREGWPPRTHSFGQKRYTYGFMRLGTVMADAKLEGAVSTIPTQYAISILKNSNQDLGRQIVNSGERVEKIAPLLVIGAVMALEGVRRSQGGQGSLFSPIMNIGAGLFNAGEAIGHHIITGDDAARDQQLADSGEAFKDIIPSFMELGQFENQVRLEDPITGGLLIGEDGGASNYLGVSDQAVIEDPSWKQRMVAGGLGALQGFTPGAITGTAGAGIRAGGSRLAREGAEAAQRQATQYADDVSRTVSQYADDAAAGVTRTQPTIGSTTDMTASPIVTPAPGMSQPVTTGSRFGTQTTRQVPLRDAATGATGRRQQSALRDLQAGGARVPEGVVPFTSINDPLLSQSIRRLGPAEQRLVQGMRPNRVAGSTRQRLGERMQNVGRKQSTAEVAEQSAKRRGLLGPSLVGGGLAGLGYGIYGAAQTGAEIADKLIGGGGLQGFMGAGGSEGVGGYSNMQQGHGQGVGAGMGGHGRFDAGAFDPFANVATQTSVGTPEQEIWSGIMEQQRGGHYGSAVKTGENMKIGERMLKEATERMYKAKCAECGKDCVSKAHCTALKAEGLEMVEHDGKKVPKFAADGKGADDLKTAAEDDMNKKQGSKKPAHGMVIVIGSKAGPGPYKNGKRQKLESEKKKE
jgi:hypothetical protein